MKIKSDSTNEFHKTYKRIVSKKGYRSRISFTEYRYFYEYLFNLIDSEDPFSNIQYYKLEKRMGFEIHKTILMAMRKSKQARFAFDEKTVMSDLLMVTRLPIIKGRHILTEVYPELDSVEDILKWRYIVRDGINKFINYAVQHVQHKINVRKYSILDNVNLSKFQSIYTPESFIRDYKLRRDFSAADFKNLMSHIDDHTKRKYG